MFQWVSRRAVVSLMAVAAIVIVLSPSLGGLRSGIPTARATTASIQFRPNTVVDDQRLAGEPDVKICGPDATWSYGNCGQNNPYVSVP